MKQFQLSHQHNWICLLTMSGVSLQEKGPNTSVSPYIYFFNLAMSMCLADWIQSILKIHKMHCSFIFVLKSFRCGVDVISSCFETQRMSFKKKKIQLLVYRKDSGRGKKELNQALFLFGGEKFYLAESYFPPTSSFLTGVSQVII